MPVEKLYKIKLKPERLNGILVWGFVGHKGPLSWAELAKVISKVGVSKVEYVQHADKSPVNTHRFDGKEMLSGRSIYS